VLQCREDRVDLGGICGTFGECNTLRVRNGGRKGEIEGEEQEQECVRTGDHVERKDN